jgi:hypothetical protein
MLRRRAVAAERGAERMIRVAFTAKFVVCALSGCGSVAQAVVEVRL